MVSFCSMLEHEYLKFLSDIAKDIRVKKVFTEAGMEQLFQSHVEGSKHRLREVEARDEAPVCYYKVYYMHRLNSSPAGYHVAEDSTAEERTRPASPTCTVS